MAKAGQRRWRRPAWGKLGLLALSIAALAAAWHYTPLATYIAPQRMVAFARWLGSVKWAPLAVAAAYTPAAFVMFPRPLLSLLAIVAFGLWLGGACIVAGRRRGPLCRPPLRPLLPARTGRA